MSQSSSEEQKPRARGLRSVQQAREARASGKQRWPSVKFWGYAALVLAVGAVLQWKWSAGEIESKRQKLMANQRAVAAELGPRWFPLRDKIEGWTMELAKDAGAEVVDAEALAKWDFRERAGIYLRLRVEDATTAESIRTGARGSLRDGFTGCLVTGQNPMPAAGQACKRTRDCPAHEFCNEQDHCSRPAQPFNLRVAYRTMYLLSDEWVREVQDAGTELRLRLFQTNYEDTVHDDVPVAVDLLTRAQYFLLVLDETPKGAALPAGDAGAAAAEAVQAMDHHARVGVWRLSDGKLVLRVRREAAGELLGVSPTVDEKIAAAAQRQTNNCALALSVRRAMGDKNAVAVPPPN